ncbi:MAG: tetratricopeptide repeat protein [Syntrophorhabdaceae bacterium]|nr:tetratricopeptide repeat protein [Syntrophorhabdaceae bacterium]
MKYKIFFLLLFIFVLFYVYIDHLNPDNVKFYIGGGRFLETGIATYVMASFLVGVLLSMIVSLFSDLGKTIVNWKEEKKEKKKEELKEFFERARAYDLKGDREKAIDILNRIIRKVPEVEETYLYLADIHLSMKEYEKALDILKLAEMNLGKKETVSLKKAKAMLAMNDGENMETELKEVISKNESNIEALEMLRNLYVSKKDWDKALEIEKRITRFVKTEEENRRLLGIRLERLKVLYNKNFEDHGEEITKGLKEIIGEDKRFVPAYILLADVYKRTGKLNEAGRVYGRGYSKTGHIIFLLKMEDLYIERRTPEVILKIYRRLLDISPKNGVIEFLYARLCLRLEMIDEAIEALNTLLASGADFKALHKAMAEAYIHRGEMDKAVMEFRLAFPPEHVYIPFICNNCKTKKVEWSEFCDVCFSWNTIVVRREDFLQAEMTEIKRLYESENWEGEGEVR